MKITPKIQKAINIAAFLHANQKRKGNDVPFIAHPFTVAMIIANYADDEDVISAGLLHDVLEDVPGYSAQDMARDFGERVLGFVKEVTEMKKPTDGPDRDKITWRFRKEKYIEHLLVASEEAMMICAADKIHNLSSLSDDYKVKGEALWKVFSAPKSRQLWFYEEILKVLKDRLKSPIVEELEEVYRETMRVIGE